MTPNLKLILGLVWTLILHYQIALGLAGDEVVMEGTAATPKQALLTFVNVSLPKVVLNCYHCVKPQREISVVGPILFRLTHIYAFSKHTLSGPLTRLRSRPGVLYCPGTSSGTKLPEDT